MRFHYKRIAVIVLIVVALGMWAFIFTFFGGSVRLPGFGGRRVKKKKIDTIQDIIEEDLSK